MEQLLEKILEKLKKTPEVQVFKDLYHVCLEVMKTDRKLATRYLVELSAECERAIANGKSEMYLKDIFLKPIPLRMLRRMARTRLL